MSRKAKESLRCGFTTGAAAAAAGVAAYRFQVEKQLPERVDLLFPDGQIREFKITASETGAARVIKDAGDDPDVTDKARISANFQFLEIDDLRPEDYVIDIGLGKLFLRGGAGVGLCRRRGLDCDEGKWAINKVPRRMIAENLKRAGFGKAEVCGLLTIEVADGRNLARKTLNAKLGIEGGISILGTSGIVYPYSHKAYIKTIAVLVKAVAESGGREVVFCTGGRTLKAAQIQLPQIPDEAFIRIGDFISASLEEAAKARCKHPGLEHAVIVCMPGKLCKYAAGFSYTHAASVAQTLMPLVEIVTELMRADAALGGKIAHCASVRQALSLLPDNIHQPALEKLTDAALSALKEWAPTLSLRLLLYDYNGNLLVDRGTIANEN
jgi:cobalt-precorrin-5B (C1)-methyltransferase